MEKIITADKWPTQSLDLNLIEHLRDTLRHKLTKRKHKINDKDQLTRVVYEEWSKITPETCSK